MHTIRRKIVVSLLNNTNLITVSYEEICEGTEGWKKSTMCVTYSQVNWKNKLLAVQRWSDLLDQSRKVVCGNEKTCATSTEKLSY